MKTYICTCGTSIATKKGINLERYEKEPLSEWQFKKEEIEAIKNQIRDHLSGIRLPADIDDTSAEIKSLVKMGLGQEDEVILITSDTIEGKLCAESVKEFLTEQGLCENKSVQIKEINGLQAQDGKKFQKEGLKNLLSFLESFKDQNVVFNPTGGFKSVVPYVTLMGMIFNKPIKYIHENSADVLTLTGLPLVLNDDLILRVETKLRKIEAETGIPKDEWQAGIDFHDNRFDCLIEEDDGQVTFSGIGLSFWDKFKQDYPIELIRDERSISEKKNKLRGLGVDHHGIGKIRPIADKLLQSPFVKEIPNSCDNQPRTRNWIKSLSVEEAKNHLQIERNSICIVTDIRSDAGYSFLIETTARNTEENWQIAQILNRKYFN